jgi:hypothetical protein
MSLIPSLSQKDSKLIQLMKAESTSVPATPQALDVKDLIFFAA